MSSIPYTQPAAPALAATREFRLHLRPFGLSLAWVLAMMFAAYFAAAMDSAPGRWVGIHFAEGGSFYRPFESEQACIAAMGTEAFTCHVSIGKEEATAPPR